MVERRVYPTTRRFTDPWGFETQLTMSSDPDLFLKVRPYQYARAPRENVPALLKMLGRRKRFLGEQTLGASRGLESSIREKEILFGSAEALHLAIDLVKRGQEVPEEVIDSISKRPETACYFAIILVENNREVPEKIIDSISKSAESSYDFARYLLRNRKEVPEKILYRMSKEPLSPVVSYFFAKYLIRNNREVSEELIDSISESSEYSYEFAKFLVERDREVSDKILNSLPEDKKQEILQLMQRKSQTSIQGTSKESSLLKMLAKLSSLVRVAKIVKRKGKYCVISETTGRSFGCYPTKEQAKKRLRQIEFFKYLSKKKKKKSSLELESQTYTDVEMREVYRKMPYEPYLTTYPGKYLPSTDVDTFRRMPMDLLVPIVKRYPSFPTYPRASPVDFLAYPNTLRLGRVRFNPITNTLYCVVTWDKPDFVDASDEEIKRTIINYVRDHFRGLREILVDEVKLNRERRVAILRVEEAFEVPISHRRVSSGLSFDFDLNFSSFEWDVVGGTVKVMGTFLPREKEKGISPKSPLSFSARVKIGREGTSISEISIPETFVYSEYLRTLAREFLSTMSEEAIEDLKRQIREQLVERLLRLEEIESLKSFGQELQIELEPLVSYEKASGFVVLGSFKIPFRSSIEAGRRVFDFKVSQFKPIESLIKSFLVEKLEEISEKVEQRIKEVRGKEFPLREVMKILDKLKGRVKGIVSKVSLGLDELEEREKMFLSKFRTSDEFLSRASQEFRSILDPRELLRFMEDSKHYMIRWRVVGQSLELSKILEK